LEYVRKEDDYFGYGADYVNLPNATNLLMSTENEFTCRNTLKNQTLNKFPTYFGINKNISQLDYSRTYRHKRRHVFKRTESYCKIRKLKTFTSLKSLYYGFNTLRKNTYLAQQPKQVKPLIFLSADYKFLHVTNSYFINFEKKLLNRS
jgi:hypothetical protein